MRARWTATPSRSVVDGREFKATLNAQNLVEKVSYLSTNEVVGDYPVEIAYTDYADFGGVKFPRHIVQTEDGHPTLDITVNEVKPNAAVVDRRAGQCAQRTAAGAAGERRQARRRRVVFRHAQCAQLGGRVPRITSSSSKASAARRARSR